MGAGIWAAAGAKGLWRERGEGAWERMEAPEGPRRLALGNGRTAISCSGGEVFDPIRQRLLLDCPGVEAMALSPDGTYLYLLSGEGDSVLCCRWETGEPLYLNRAGVYPRDMRLEPGGRLLAVAAGAAGEVLIFSAPELKLIRRVPVPGVAYRAVFMPGGLAVMLAAEDGQLVTLLGRITPRRGVFEELVRLPGLPGDLCPCPGGTVAAGGSDFLVALRWHPFRQMKREHRLGLPGRLCTHPRGLLVSDDLMGRLSLITPAGEQTLLEAEEIFALWQV